MATFHVLIDPHEGDDAPPNFDVEADMMTSNDHWAFFYDARKQLVALVPREKLRAIARQDVLREGD